MEKYNILIFPYGTEIANEVINSLANHKYFNIILASSENLSHGINELSKIHFLPYVEDSNFLFSLNNIIKKENISFLIPAHDDVAFEFSQIENKIHAKVIGQSKFVNDIVRFKDVTYEYFTDKMPLGKIFKEKPQTNDFPVFVKPKKGQGSFNAFKLENINDFDLFFNKNQIQNYIVMENFTGDEFTIDCFSNDGKVLYFGARTREKVIKGISVKSTLVSDDILNKYFSDYSNLISKNLNMHGLWFYQMKIDKNNQLKLLEIGARLSGTMMLNRARGVNFIELAIYQKLGFYVEIVFNNIDISLHRTLVPTYKHNIAYDNLYIDFDDTLCISENKINTDLIKLIFKSKNNNKNVYLITKNNKLNLAKFFHKFGIFYIFDDIIHIKPNDQKHLYMKKNSVLIDDSFSERKEAIKFGHIVFGVDNFNVLL